MLYIISHKIHTHYTYNYVPSWYFIKYSYVDKLVLPTYLNQTKPILRHKEVQNNYILCVVLFINY